MLEGSENIGKILLISFNDNEEEIIEQAVSEKEELTHHATGNPM